MNSPLDTSAPEQISLCDLTGSVALNNPTSMPKAAGFLWNDKLLLQMNSRGFAVAQFMQPEPAKYAHAPVLEAKTFIQPEHHYFTHHPGRFFYIRDNKTGEIFSLPYEPVKHPEQTFTFICHSDRFEWHSECLGLNVTLRAHLTPGEVCEFWKITVNNVSGDSRSISVFAYCPVGYMSWMNQSAAFSDALNGVVCHSITPYQKVEDYFKNKHLNDLTYLVTDADITGWETRQVAFEGEGGLHAPSALTSAKLANGASHYDMPTAVLQCDKNLAPNEQHTLRFMFGPAQDEAEIARLTSSYLADASDFEDSLIANTNAMDLSVYGWQQSTSDHQFDHFVNHWLKRQMHYHGDVNRLSTDPQTRNYLQDAMGMIYLKPNVARKAFITAISQQLISGAMPDGILLHESAELKYINQVPHTDHNIWLPVVLSAYFSETADYSLLDEQLPYQDSDACAPVKAHICQAMDYLWQARDERGLHYINQGDWCDPMNMVGYKGKGVSVWLTLATSVAMSMWAEILERTGSITLAKQYKTQADCCNQAVNKHCWDGDWFARGITDDGNLFGISADSEGKIFLNPQSWAMLANAISPEQKAKIMAAINEHLVTPFGTAMLAPAFTKMREDIGRVTQKFPGTAENGSVYNHAAAFYIYALYQHGEGEEAYRQLKMMIPDLDDAYLKRGQLPIFIPNYFRGAFHQYTEVAGRSSQLFNTGTCAWIARSLLEGLFGLKGTTSGLTISPQLPKHLTNIAIVRYFRGAILNIKIRKVAGLEKKTITVNGQPTGTPGLVMIESGNSYEIDVAIPEA